MIAEVKKETIIIPRIQKLLAKRSVQKKKFPLTLFPFLIVFLFAGLLVLISYLPISQILKIMALIIGSFILEDVLHFLKKIYVDIDTLRE